MNGPDPRLTPLLEKHGLDWDTFKKRGRPAPGVSQKRAAIVTEIHAAGTPWVEMVAITGLSLMGIQRLTQATGNEASRQNRRDSAAKNGHARKGEVKPWLSEQLRVAWKDGVFDFHRGSVRSEEDREKLRASWTPERRARIAEKHRILWRNAAYRDRLLAFHRSPEERARRSQAQARRVAENPQYWCWGRGCRLSVSKCSNGPKIWVRSTHEKAAVAILESNTDILEYQYEARISLPNGHEILPDFIARHSDGSRDLIEVKASWVFKMPPEHRISRRLQVAREFAASHGWAFHIWTEKDVLHDTLCPTTGQAS